MGVANGAPSLESPAGVLKGSSASVTAFSPNGLLLAVAVEEAPKKWYVKVCTEKLPWFAQQSCMLVAGQWSCLKHAVAWYPPPVFCSPVFCLHALQYIV